MVLILMYFIKINSYYLLYSYHIIYCIHIILYTVFILYYILYSYCILFILYTVLLFAVFHTQACYLVWVSALYEFVHSLSVFCTILCLLSVQSLKKLQRDMVTYTKVKILCTCSVLKLYSLTWQTMFSYPLFSNMTNYKCFIS